MQHRRPRLMAKILAFVLAVSLVFPVSAFASVADLADDTRVPGKSLANTYPNLPVDWQVSLAEDTKDVTVRVPVSLTADSPGSPQTRSQSVMSSMHDRGSDSRTRSLERASTRSKPSARAARSRTQTLSGSWGRAAPGGCKARSWER